MANKTGLNTNNKRNFGGTNVITSIATNFSTNSWIDGNLRISELKLKHHSPFFSSSSSKFIENILSFLTYLECVTQ